jgi:hypothetical protein
VRIHLIGDIGGHLDVFAEALILAGVDVAARAIPEGTLVIQVGDLVHKGPDDDGCVALADDLLATGRYLQLWGNHDAHYIGGPDVSARPGVSPVGPASTATFRRWADTGAARLAVALDTVELGPALVTHGGLTRGLWQELGSPADAGEAAMRINALLTDPERAFRPGWLMTGVHDRAAGVTCPRTGAELAGPWLERGAMPFHQIHGHESTWWWPHDRFHDDCPPEVAAATTLDTSRRHCWVEVGGMRLWSIDWVLGAAAPAGVDWSPLALEGEVLA